MEDVIKTATTTLGSPLITVAENRDLITGLYVYGTNIPLCTKILSISSLNTTELTLTTNALGNGSSNLTFSDLNVWMFQDRCDMYKEIYNNVQEIGANITIYLRDETDIVRDDYNSIKQRYAQNKYNMKAYPITYNPAKDVLEKCGLRQDITMMIYIPRYAFILNSLTFGDIEPNRSTVIVDGGTWQITDKSQFSEFGNTQAYYVLGLVKK